MKYTKENPQIFDDIYEANRSITEHIPTKPYKGIPGHLYVKNCVAKQIGEIPDYDEDGYANKTLDKQTILEKREEELKLGGFITDDKIELHSRRCAYNLRERTKECDVDGDFIYYIYLGSAFAEGIKWYKNNIWHSSKTKPYEGEMIIYAYKDKNNNILISSSIPYGANYKWAYLNEVIPIL